jgi:hypothetical protein
MGDGIPSIRGRIEVVRRANCDHSFAHSQNAGPYHEDAWPNREDGRPHRNAASAEEDAVALEVRQAEARLDDDAER